MEKNNGCTRCPRNCGIVREQGGKGFCGVPGTEIYLARAALHFWEEPCISGMKGSGTVFFCGCNLRCIYCQNAGIASMREARAVPKERLPEIFLELQEKGAHNINLVTPTHYVPEVREALSTAKAKGLVIPVVYNCGGYEGLEGLRSLQGLADIYLMDFKYMDPDLASRFSSAPDYPETAKAALSEMVRQQPEPVFDEAGLMTKGVIVRHLLLPGHVKNAKAVVSYVYQTYGDRVYLSLMNQYTPMREFPEAPELSRRVTKREYGRLTDYALSLGVANAFIQEGGTAEESFIPPFNFEGL